MKERGSSSSSSSILRSCLHSYWPFDAIAYLSDSFRRLIATRSEPIRALSTFSECAYKVPLSKKKKLLLPTQVFGSLPFFYFFPSCHFSFGSLALMLLKKVFFCDIPRLDPRSNLLFRSNVNTNRNKAITITSVSRDTHLFVTVIQKHAKFA